MSSITFPSGFMNINFQRYYQTTPCPRGRMRCLAMLHLQKGRTIKETAEIVQQSRIAVHTWLNWLREEGGLAHLVGFVKGRGRKSKVNCIDEEKIRISIEKLKEDRQGGRITGKDIQQMLKNKWDVWYELSSIYVLLKRLNIVWITSRSQHPKADIEVQEEFKKKISRQNKADLAQRH
jgi:transposase